jgi:hypothetical protein
MSNQPLVFGKKNYIILIASIIVIAVGYVLMSSDKEQYGFGFLGLTLGPAVVLIGFGLVFWSILFKEKK